MIVFAIESSCDETAVALVKDGREVLANIINTQIETHKAYGGVVPEIASRRHLEDINAVVDAALSEAGCTPKDIDIIGVTKGPGLIGSVLVGVCTAKALAFAWDKPLVGVHHIAGHISANFIENKELEPPFLALVISGGHTEIVEVSDYTKFKALGGTRDDAAGEAYDKVARVLGLGYPGGPLIDKAAREGDPHAVEFKRTMLEKGTLDFSFSGIKTGVLNYVNSERQAGREISVADTAAAFQASVVDVVTIKTMQALKETGYKKLALAGGVAANSALRARLEEDCKKMGVTFFRPSPVLCTDNAAMIGSAAYYKYLADGPDSLAMDAYASLAL